jgi:hypothetical protein
MMIKKIFKIFAAKLPVDFYQRLLAHSIARHQFASLNDCPTHSTRENLWNTVSGSSLFSNSNVTYIEFGVHEGYSIKYFANQNQHTESVFYGLDSFEGLPENWGPMKKGTFSTSGKMPTTSDPRVKFIKGWFQYSWDSLQEALLTRDLENLIVHYDADLYSSTLFALTKVDLLCKPYIAIFDEFLGHETRALFNYSQSYGATVKFLGKTVMTGGYPSQVVCQITPLKVLD